MFAGAIRPPPFAYGEGWGTRHACACVGAIGMLGRRARHALPIVSAAILVATAGCIDNSLFAPATTTVASGLNNPTGVAVRSDGTVLIAESGAGRIALVDANGDLSTWVTGFTVGSFFPYDIGPLSLVVLADGSVLVGEGGNSTGRERISFYDNAGVENLDATLVPVSGSNFNSLAIHPTTGDLYAASSESDRIFRFAAVEGSGFSTEQDFVPDTTLPPIGRRAPSGLAFEADGMLLVALADFEASGIVRLTTAPDAETVLVDLVYESARTVTAVAVDVTNGDVYFTEADYTGNQLGPGRVARITQSGGQPITETLIDGLVAPAALTFGPDGALYVATLGDTPNADAGVVLRVDIGKAAAPPAPAAPAGLSTNETAPRVPHSSP